MSFIVEHECPQCGAPVDLEETHRILRCPYCEVKNYMFARDMFRFVLPYTAPGKDILYAPYLRFKGVAYLCKDITIKHRIVDITRLGTSFTALPMSLGFRPQTLKMKFITPHDNSLFLASSVNSEDILNAVGQQTSALVSTSFNHRAYIGEVFSIIYLPIFVEKNRLYDAVTHECITSLPDGQAYFDSAVMENPQWQISFIATMCPNCGWDLNGERDSVVLTCHNCNSAWEAANGRLIPVNCETVIGGKDKTIYLPFWKINAISTQGLEFISYGDFMRITNQPRAVQQEWENMDMSFWVPAFKIRPRIFLHLSKHMTLAQQAFETKAEIPNIKAYPVTLPLSEAIQSMKITLADSIMNKRTCFPLLPQVKIAIGETSLVYIPFHETNHEIIQEQMCVSVNTKTLEYGRLL
jgi:DNA-directed RNA polymerase subunit RPC12/RpoP